jgi:hypothetical protein
MCEQRGNDRSVVRHDHHGLALVPSPLHVRDGLADLADAFVAVLGVPVHHYQHGSSSEQARKQSLDLPRRNVRRHGLVKLFLVPRYSGCEQRSHDPEEYSPFRLQAEDDEAVYGDTLANDEV